LHYLWIGIDRVQSIEVSIFEGLKAQAFGCKDRHVVRNALCYRQQDTAPKAVGSRPSRPVAGTGIHSKADASEPVTLG